MFYIPKKTPKLPAILSVVMYAIATAAFILSEFFSPRLVFQLIALLFISVGILLTVKYLLTSYKYVITDGDEEDKEEDGEENARFTVVRINGSRETPMGSFHIKHIYAIERKMSRREFEKKHGRLDKVYNYAPNLASADECLLALKFNGMKIVLVIELCEPFEAQIRARMKDTPEENEEEGK